MKYFSSGLLVGLIGCVFVGFMHPTKVLSMFAHIGEVKVQKICDPNSQRCFFMRTETSTGVDYTTVQSIHWSRFDALFLQYTRARVQCDAEANFAFKWLPDALEITSDSNGECFEAGKYTPPYAVSVVNR